MDRLLLINIYRFRDRIFRNVIQTTIDLKWLNNNFPMDETLKRTSRLCCDKKGEVFLYHDGVYYSWEIIISIVKRDGILTYHSLFDAAVNE